jgi:hypothetical protein
MTTSYGLGTSIGITRYGTTTRTTEALVAADLLINKLADWNMNMPLPKGIPTLKHMVTRNYSRPDNVFFIDGKEFNERLEQELTKFGPPRTIATEDQFHETIIGLTKAIRDTIEEKFPTNKPCPHSKRWWNLDLKTMKKHVGKLSDVSFKFRALPDHPSHQELKEARDKYAEEISKAKTQHWATYLEEATEEHLRTANKYLTEPVGDGGRTRIPTLKVNNHAQVRPFLFKFGDSQSCFSQQS